jgi:hypothetical protein
MSRARVSRTKDRNRDAEEPLAVTGTSLLLRSLLPFPRFQQAGAAALSCICSIQSRALGVGAAEAGSHPRERRRAEPAGLAGAQGFFSQGWWLAGSMGADGQRLEDKCLGPPTSSHSTTGDRRSLEIPGEEKHVVHCKLLKEMN